MNRLLNKLLYKELPYKVLAPIVRTTSGIFYVLEDVLRRQNGKEFFFSEELGWVPWNYSPTMFSLKDLMNQNWSSMGRHYLVGMVPGSDTPSISVIELKKRFFQPSEWIVYFRYTGFVSKYKKDSFKFCVNPFNPLVQKFKSPEEADKARNICVGDWRIFYLKHTPEEIQKLEHFVW